MSIPISEWKQPTFLAFAKVYLGLPLVAIFWIGAFFVGAINAPSIILFLILVMITVIVDWNVKRRERQRNRRMRELSEAIDSNEVFLVEWRLLRMTKILGGDCGLVWFCSGLMHFRGSNSEFSLDPQWLKTFVNRSKTDYENGLTVVHDELAKCVTVGITPKSRVENGELHDLGDGFSKAVETWINEKAVATSHGIFLLLKLI